MTTANNPKNQQPHGLGNLGQITLQPIHGAYLDVPGYGVCPIEVEVDSTTRPTSYRVRIALETDRVIYLAEIKGRDTYFTNFNQVQKAIRYWELSRAMKAARDIASHVCPGCSVCH